MVQALGLETCESYQQWIKDLDDEGEGEGTCRKASVDEGSRLTEGLTDAACDLEWNEWFSCWTITNHKILLVETVPVNT